MIDYALALAGSGGAKHHTRALSSLSCRAAWSLSRSNSRRRLSSLSPPSSQPFLSPAVQSLLRRAARAHRLARAADRRSIGAACPLPRLPTPATASRLLRKTWTRQT